jgi:hypothetical protein
MSSARSVGIPLRADVPPDELDELLEHAEASDLPLMVTAENGQSHKYKVVRLSSQEQAELSSQLRAELKRNQAESGSLVKMLDLLSTDRKDASR